MTDKKLPWLALLVFVTMPLAWAQHDDSHTFPSTYPGVKEIFNVHRISEGEFPGEVVRGFGLVEYDQMTDNYRTRIPHLMATVKPTHVLIFKNQNFAPGDVDEELRQLTDPQGVARLPKDRILNVAFPWKKMDPWPQTCRQVVSALWFIQNAASKGGRVYVHCTVGEDRTGVLAGIYRLLFQSQKYGPRTS
jgi:hypothetical protein